MGWSVSATEKERVWACRAGVGNQSRERKLDGWGQGEGIHEESRRASAQQITNPVSGQNNLKH